MHRCRRGRRPRRGLVSAGGETEGERDTRKRARCVPFCGCAAAPEIAVLLGEGGSPMRGREERELDGGRGVGDALSPCFCWGGEREGKEGRRRRSSPKTKKKHAIGASQTQLTPPPAFFSIRPPTSFSLLCTTAPTYTLLIARARPAVVLTDCAPSPPLFVLVGLHIPPPETSARRRPRSLLSSATCPAVDRIRPGRVARIRRAPPWAPTDRGL